MSAVVPTLPYVGAVIRYGYLWRDEARRLRDGGRKDRPCLIVAAAALDKGVRVYVAPITRARQPPDTSITLSRPVRRKLGLDTDHASWLVVTETNHFLWRGADVVPVAPGVEHYGRLDDKIVIACRQRFLAGVRAALVKPTSRDPT